MAYTLNRRKFSNPSLPLHFSGSFSPTSFSLIHGPNLYSSPSADASCTLNGLPSNPMANLISENPVSQVLSEPSLRHRVVEARCQSFHVLGCPDYNQSVQPLPKHNIQRSFPSSAAPVPISQIDGINHGTAAGQTIGLPITTGYLVSGTHICHQGNRPGSNQYITDAILQNPNAVNRVCIYQPVDNLNSRPYPFVHIEINAIPNPDAISCWENGIPHHIYVNSHFPSPHTPPASHAPGDGHMNTSESEQSLVQTPRASHSYVHGDDALSHKLHTCRICRKNFGAHQGLAGHMKCHYRDEGPEEREARRDAKRRKMGLILSLGL